MDNENININAESVDDVGSDINADINIEETPVINEADAARSASQKTGRRSRGKNKRTLGGEIISWIKTIVLALILAYIITHFLIVNAVVPSASMENTVMTGDRLVANRLSYMFSEPERFDIVVFKYPDDESILYIKRIIGMPGETIEIKDGNVYIDGDTEPVKADFVNGIMDTADISRYPAVYKIPKKGDNISDYTGISDSSVYDNDGDGKFDSDCYFMMGDNRNNSSDSRFWSNQYLSENKIEGKAVFRYWPLNTIGTIK